MIDLLENINSIKNHDDRLHKLVHNRKRFVLRSDLVCLSMLLKVYVLQNHIDQYPIGMIFDRGDVSNAI